MTERKPGTVTWESWIESQILRAQREGQFDKLPGTGKPLPNLGEQQHELAWLAKKLRDDKADPAAYLPPQLVVAKEAENVRARVGDLRSESDVRDYLTGLNQRIERLHARPPAGPPVRVKLVDIDAAVVDWRRARTAEAPPPAVTETPVASRRRRWSLRRSKKAR